LFYYYCNLVFHEPSGYLQTQQKQYNMKNFITKSLLLSALFFISLNLKSQCFQEAGNCIELDGISGCVLIPNNAKFDIQNNITIEVWVYRDQQINNAINTIVSKGNHCNNSGTFDLYLRNGQVHFGYGIDNSTNNYLYRCNKVIPDREWTHVAVSYNYAQSSSIRIYINGEQESGSWLTSTTNVAPYTQNVQAFIGASYVWNNSNCPGQTGVINAFKGKIDELRIWNAIIPQADIQTWKNYSVDSWQSNNYTLIANYNFNSNIGTFTAHDIVPYYSTPVNGILQSGGTFSPSTAPIDRKSSFCSGHALHTTGNQTNAQALNINTYDGLSAITFQAWVYPTFFPATTTTNDVHSILFKGDQTMAGTAFGLTIQGNGSALQLRGMVYVNGTSMAEATIPVAGNLPLNTWTHVAVTWASGSQVRIYTNGVQRNLSGILNGTITTGGILFKIGGSSHPSEDGFRGYIDDVSIFNAQLSAATISGFRNNVITSNHPNYNDLLSYWRFQEGSGKVAVDETCRPQHHNLLVTNGTGWVGSAKPCPNMQQGTPVITADNDAFDKVVVRYSYPSDLPLSDPTTNGAMHYSLFKDGQLIQNGLASSHSGMYIDTPVTCSHEYTIRYDWLQGGQFTNGTPASVTGRTKDINFTASKGTFTNKTELKWSNISSVATGGIEILRDGQQIAVLNNGNSTLYNDFDGTPGIRYVYEMKPLALNKDYHVCPDTGWTKENGRLSGYVRSPLQAPVPNVLITTTATIHNQVFTYTDTTDASGFYEIRNVYYDQQATYTIVPSRNSRGFSPASLQRTLDIQAFTAPQANFIDTSIFTVEGRISFPDQNGNATLGCGVSGAKVLVNGVDKNIRTDQNGIFRISIEDEGNYTFTPEYKQHAFDPPSVTLFVDDNVSGVNFTDVQTDILYISVTGYCKEQLSDSAKFKIVSAGGAGCYTQDVFVPGDVPGGMGFLLPAQEYIIVLEDVISGDANMNTQVETYSNNYIHVDLSERQVVTTIDSGFSEPRFVPADTIVLSNGTLIITPADTVTDFIGMDTIISYPAAEARFLYGGKLIMEVLGFPELSSCSNQTIVLQQDNSYNIRINVFREYSFTSVFGNPPTAIVSTCPLDTGRMTIYDNISDTSSMTFPISNGHVKYTVNAGQPNTIAVPDNPNTTTIDESAYNYKKFMNIIAETPGVLNPKTEEVWAYVLGNRALTPNFITKTPELPLFILHDPPGDASYASITSGTSFTNNYSTSVYTGTSTNSFLNMQIGTEVPIPMTGITIGVFGTANFNTNVSTSETQSKSVDVTFSVSSTYSTSGDSDFVGEDADLVTGASLNVIYGLSFIVDFDTASCSATMDTALTWGSDGFATTYTYTIGHVKYTLLPQLEFLRSIYNNRFQATNDTLQRDSARLIQSYIDVWQQVVDKNRANIDTAQFIENVSFSGGIEYTRSSTYENSSTMSIEYNMAIDQGITAALGFGYGEFTEVSAGVDLLFQWNVTKSKSSTVTNTKEITYVLSDQNAGDVFSVDVMRDKAFGTPAFKIVAGASSCPHEPNTQMRDLPGIAVLNSPQINVPVTQQAVFTVRLSNLSETGETRTYNVIVDPTSNLEGAIIHLGGQLISQFPATFTIPPGAIFATLTVQKGPVAVDYRDLKLIIYSPCDDGQSAEATFSVTFQNDCSPVEIFTPSNNWLINDDNNNILQITYGGYDANNPKLRNIGLEIRRPGHSWQQINLVDVAILLANNSPIYGVAINISSFPDGPYELRAFATCSTTVATRTYSSTISGTIDRTSATLFGTPSPSDGVLNVNEEISITFSEPIDCNQAFNQLNIGTPLKIKLIRNDNGSIVPSSFVCSGNKIIITTNPVSLLDSLEGKMLTASVENVYDLNGNILRGPITWSFIVNRSKVFWQPSGIVINVVQGGTTSTTGTLRNVNPTSQSYTINQLALPSWLSLTSPASGSIVSNGSVNVDFSASGNQNIGVYYDSVIANFGGNQQKLFVQLNVYAPSPNYTPVQYANTMSIIANFSLTQNNFPLSTDINDRIAVFVGNECRGVGNIQYTQTGNSYAAFITVYSSTTTGETLRFRMWDASTGTEYEAVETQAFVANATIGQPIAPLILHPAGRVQRIPLQQGWNWFSLNVNPVDGSVGNVMKYLKNVSNATVVKTNDSYAQYSSALNSWAGTLTDIGYQKSYQIFLTQADTLHAVGENLSGNVAIPVLQGWNWVGYPKTEVENVNDYLQDFDEATNGDEIKSQTQFSVFNGSSWVGSLNNMLTGRGYKLKSLTGGTLDVALRRAAPGWAVDAYANEYNMTITAVLKVNGMESGRNVQVGAFINGNCVGLSSPQYVSNGTMPRIFLTLHGDVDSSDIEFFIYDSVNDSIYTPIYQPVVFTTDGVAGSIENAFELLLSDPSLLSANTPQATGYVLYQNQPNPFSAQTLIRFKLPKEEKVTISIYDYTGKVVQELVNNTLPEGTHQAVFTHDNLSSGMYFYQMRSGAFVQTRKMLVQH
jgi:trimeric autotransporter adhesin